MTAIILAGGKGTRLRPFTVTIPKPLLPLGDYPIIEIVIEQLKTCGVSRVVLALGHMAPFFTAFLGDGSKWGISIEYCFEDTPLGTAAPLRLIEGWDEDAIVMNGDILTTLDFSKLVEIHKTKGALATVALSQRVVKVDYGVVRTNGEGIMSEYIEKPELPYEVSMGVYVLNPGVRSYIPMTGKFDMPDLMLALRDNGHPVACYSSDCYWKDMGRFDDYEQATKDFLADSSKFVQFPT